MRHNITEGTKKDNGVYMQGSLEGTYKKLINLMKIKKSDKILDIGCGNGYFTKKIMLCSNNVRGIDPNKKVIESTKMKNCIFGTIENANFKKNYFDKIVLVHVIEHIPDLNSLFNEMKRILKKKGKIYLVYPFEPFKGFCIMKTALRVYKNPFKGYKFHVNWLFPNRIRNIANKFDLKIVKHGIIPSKFLYYPQFYSIIEK